MPTNIPELAIVGNTASLSFEVPFLPPSVNHYKQPRGRGGFFRSAASIAYVDAVCIFSRKTLVPGDTYEVDLTFYLPPSKQSLESNDLDNYLKVAIDAIGHKGAHVIVNDGRILDLHVHKRFVRGEGEARTAYVITGKENQNEKAASTAAGDTDAAGTRL